MPPNVPDAITVLPRLDCSPTLRKIRMNYFPGFGMQMSILINVLLLRFQNCPMTSSSSSFFLGPQLSCRTQECWGGGQTGALCCTQQPWDSETKPRGRLTQSSSSLPERKLFLILTAVETAYINIISTSPTPSSFSMFFFLNMFHDQKPCPAHVCHWLGWCQDLCNQGPVQ